MALHNEPSSFPVAQRHPHKFITEALSGLVCSCLYACLRHLVYVCLRVLLLWPSAILIKPSRSVRLCVQLSLRMLELSSSRVLACDPPTLVLASLSSIVIDTQESSRSLRLLPPSVSCAKRRKCSSLLLVCLAFCILQDAEADRLVQRALLPQIFALSSGSVFVKPDRYHLGMLRWSLQGTRQLLVVNEGALLVYFKSCAIGASVSLQDTWPALRELGPEQVKAFCSGAGRGQMYACTVAEGDCVYVPPGWLVCEKGLGKMVLGLQMRVIPRGPSRTVLPPLAKEMGNKVGPKTVLHGVVSELARGAAA